MTAAVAVKTSVTNNLSQDYINLDELRSPTYTDSRVQTIYFMKFKKSHEESS